MGPALQPLLLSPPLARAEGPRPAHCPADWLEFTKACAPSAQGTPPPQERLPYELKSSPFSISPWRLQLRCLHAPVSGTASPVSRPRPTFIFGQALSAGAIGWRAQRGSETCQRSVVCVQVAEPKCQCLQLFYSKGHSAVLSLHSPALKRLELHIWLPNDHPPPHCTHQEGRPKPQGHCCRGRGAGGGCRETGWPSSLRKAARRPSLGWQGAELPSPLLPAASGRQCASH